ncbi:hypothetical protein AGMMS50267_12440 [Spirochaetia bacterium]|nr:hypothetical protein AGMMS50267_12440 [Spirochaetia bacterium]
MGDVNSMGERRGGGSRRFVVMAPHRDCGPAIREYRRRLFAAGLWGAYSFPAVVPLGATERPLEAAELKVLAGAMRERAMAGTEVSGKGRGGMFTAQFDGEAMGFIDGPGGLRFCGLPLNIPAAVLPEIPGLVPYPAFVLCTALIGTEPGAEEQARKILRTVAPPPPVSFRAASVANLILRPLAGKDTGEAYSFEWAMGKPCWLPPVSGTGIQAETC